MGHDPTPTDLTDGADTLEQVPVWRFRDGVGSESDDMLAVEVPVALEYNGVSHAVMLASPADLDDFALGFSLTEGIIADASEFYGCDIEKTPDGQLVHIEIATERFLALKARRRNLAGRTGCGLCGTEALDQVVRPMTPIAHRHVFDATRLIAGMRAMHGLQPLQQSSGATHAAAWLNEAGDVACVREDVGRHNALDKLIGALVRRKTDLSTGSLLITSRASIEMVQKAAVMNVGVMAAISAPTSFAVRMAKQAGLTLIGFMRDASYVVYAHPERLLAE